MKQKQLRVKKHPPAMFRPLLWWAKLENIETKRDREDIIVSAVNEGTLDHWRWLMKTYGKEIIRRILRKRMASELHPESRNLARIIFSVPNFRHARKSPH